MGEICYFSCEKCGYGREMHIGGGMMSINPDIVNKTLKGEDLEQWNCLWKNDKVKRFIWEYAAAICKDCRELNEVFKVWIETKDGQELLLDCRCEICQKKLEPVNKKAYIKCPICGQTILRNDVVGHWD